MKYDKQKTINHPVSTTYPCCIQDFNEVVKNEDKSLSQIPNLLNDVDVLNLDCAKDKKSIEVGEERPKSMDITFAISENNNSEMVLVDFKLNFINPDNLSRENLVKKVNDSIVFLGNSIPIHNEHIFVFQHNKVQQAINRLQRMIPKIPNNYVAMDLQDLINNYFKKYQSTTISIYGGVETE
ncbi:hypothetical protein ACFFUE_04785 [Bergeyella porcorum]|uniref:hypothetical protein n=1 Tax=Bergeyella porcorum TaxID=1735111 RepID=UPI0035E7E10D